jgi:hypothetical protein
MTEPTTETRDKQEICRTRVENPKGSAVTAVSERNQIPRGSISAAQIGTKNGNTTVPKKQKALQRPGFRIAGAGFEPATFGL